MNHGQIQGQAYRQRPNKMHQLLLMILRTFYTILYETPDRLVEMRIRASVHGAKPGLWKLLFIVGQLRFMRLACNTTSCAVDREF
jgi:hypothetical protein